MPEPTARFVDVTYGGYLHALDLKRVSDIRVGWGGYFGAEHEKVQFSVALPQAGTVARDHK